MKHKTTLSAHGRDYGRAMGASQTHFNLTISQNCSFMFDLFGKKYSLHLTVWSKDYLLAGAYAI